MPRFSFPTIDNGVPLDGPIVDGDVGDMLVRNSDGGLSFATPPAPTNVVAESISSTNRSVSTIQAGQPCAIYSGGLGFVPANATDNTLMAVGLAQAAIAPTAAGIVQTSGPLQLSDWTAVTGTATLSPRAKYWLDVTAGRLTSTPPSARGNVLQPIGEAVASDTLLIQIQSEIQL